MQSRSTYERDNPTHVTALQFSKIRTRSWSAKTFDCVLMSMTGVHGVCTSLTVIRIYVPLITIDRYRLIKGKTLYISIHVQNVYARRELGQAAVKVGIAFVAGTLAAVGQLREAEVLHLLMVSVDQVGGVFEAGWCHVVALLRTATRAAFRQTLVGSLENDKRVSSVHSLQLVRNTAICQVIDAL